MINQSNSSPNQSHSFYAPAGQDSLAGLVGTQQAPTNPTLHTSADELLKFISELEFKAGRIDAYLFGERVESSGAVQPIPESLEQKIAGACTRAAMLCGFTGTMLAKLSSNPT